MASAEVDAFAHGVESQSEMRVDDLCSWQDVYASYGCSDDFDAESDDDGD